MVASSCEVRSSTRFSRSLLSCLTASSALLRSVTSRIMASTKVGFAIVRLIHRAYGAQRQLDVDLLAVLPHRGKVQRRVGVDVAAVARRGIAGYPRPVGGLERFGNQLFHAQFEGL